MPLTGIVLTRVDGDGRGGAALSMRAVTGKPIKLMGTGEKLDALEEFYPAAHRRPHPRHGRRGRPGREGDRDGRARQGRGASPARCKKGAFDLDDLAEQLKQMQKLGGMGGVLDMLPGIGKMKKQLDAAKLDDDDPEAPAGDDRLDDQVRAQEPETAQCLAQEARRGGLGHERCRTSTSW